MVFPAPPPAASNENLALLSYRFRDRRERPESVSYVLFVRPSGNFAFLRTADGRSRRRAVIEVGKFRPLSMKDRALGKRCAFRPRAGSRTDRRGSTACR